MNVISDFLKVPAKWPFGKYVGDLDGRARDVTVGNAGTNVEDTSGCEFAWELLVQCFAFRVFVATCSHSGASRQCHDVSPEGEFSADVVDIFAAVWIVAASDDRYYSRDFSEHDGAADVPNFDVLYRASADTAEIGLFEHEFLASLHYHAVYHEFLWAGFFTSSAADAVFVQLGKLRDVSSGC